MTSDNETIFTITKAIVPDYTFTDLRNQLTLIITPDKLVDLLTEFRDNPETSFDQLLDITAIDWYKAKFRFEVVYFLWSNKFKKRLRIKVPLTGNKPHIPSVTSVWLSANWYERETSDMYGIKFDGHPNLRRFYMPEDFVDPESGEALYPLRKDFPLMGIPNSLPLPPYPERDTEVS